MRCGSCKGSGRTGTQPCTGKACRKHQERVLNASGTKLKNPDCSTCGGSGWKMYECFHCGGTGNEPAPPSNVCGFCNGSGHPTRTCFCFAEQPDLRPNPRCRDCNGTRRFPDKARTCDECHGTGTISAPVTQSTVRERQSSHQEGGAQSGPHEGRRNKRRMSRDPSRSSSNRDDLSRGVGTPSSNRARSNDLVFQTEPDRFSQSDVRTSQAYESGRQQGDTPHDEPGSSRTRRSPSYGIGAARELFHRPQIESYISSRYGESHTGTSRDHGGQAVISQGQRPRQHTSTSSSVPHQSRGQPSGSSRDQPRPVVIQGVEKKKKRPTMGSSITYEPVLPSPSGYRPSGYRPATGCHYCRYIGIEQIVCEARGCGGLSGNVNCVFCRGNGFHDHPGLKPCEHCRRH